MTTIRWLGQAGFEITASAGESCLIDPYLSDWCAQYSQNPRVPPIALDPAATRPTLVVFSHWHDDHLDPYSIPIIARSSPATRFRRTAILRLRCIGWGIEASRVVALARGELHANRPVRGHRRLRPSRSAGHARRRRDFDRHRRRRVIASSTRATPNTTPGMKAIRASGDIDVGMFVINGTGGNMNAREAAFLATELGVGVAIPMHYGMWRTREIRRRRHARSFGVRAAIRDRDRPEGDRAQARRDFSVP